ncbi:unnamed protein product, partial [Cutaneotrichosporon oleaginosum]
GATGGVDSSLTAVQKRFAFLVLTLSIPPHAVLDVQWRQLLLLAAQSYWIVENSPSPAIRHALDRERELALPDSSRGVRPTPDSSRAGVATLALSTLGTNQTAAQPLHAKTWASGTHARSMVAPFDCSARLLACDTSYRAFEGGGHACRNSGRQLWKSSSASRRVSSSTRAAGQCCIPSASSVMSWYGFGGASDRWSKAHPQAQVHTQPLRWRDGLGSHLSLEDATRGCCLLAHAH